MRKVGIFTVGLLFLSTLLYPLTQAQLNQITQNLNKIQRNLRIREEEDFKNLRKFQTRKKKKKITKKEVKKKKQHQEGPKWLIKKIVLEGCHVLKRKEVNKILHKYEGTEMGIDEINKIMTELTQLYFKKGYITSRVYLKPGQLLSKGKLYLTVVEGKLKDIQIKDNRRGSTINRRYVFPHMLNKPLNLRDIEQGLDQINRLPSNSAKMQILPGENLGESKLLIKNQAREPYTYNLSYDNTGSSSTGKWSLNYSLIMDNPTGKNDSFGFTYRRTLPYKPWKYSASVIANYSVPDGYWTYSYSLSDSEYVSRVPLSNGDFAKTSGGTLSLSLNIDRVLFRNALSSLHGYFNFTTKKIQNYMEGGLIEVSSFTLAPVEIGLNYSTFWKGGALSAKLGYTDALSPNSFGIDDAIRGQDERGIDISYHKVTANITYNKPFQTKMGPLSYNLDFNYQYSEDNLPPAEQFSIGGYYTVRGFNANSLSGNKGWYWRNEFTLTPKNNMTKTKSLSLVAAYDLGHISKDPERNIEGGFLSGYGYGMKWRLNKSFISLMNTVSNQYPHSFGKAEKNTFLSFSTTFDKFKPIVLDFSKDKKWFISYKRGTTTFRTNPVYATPYAKFRYKTRVGTNVFSIGKKIRRSKLYLSAYDFNQPSDCSMSMYKIGFETQVSNRRIHPYVGLSAGYGFYKEAGLRDKNPDIVITADNVHKRDKIVLRGLVLGAKIGIEEKLNDRWEVAFEYEYNKLYDRYRLYWDGVIEDHEIEYIYGYRGSITYKF